MRGCIQADMEYISDRNRFSLAKLWNISYQLTWYLEPFKSLPEKCTSFSTESNTYSNRGEKSVLSFLLFRFSFSFRVSPSRALNHSNAIYLSNVSSALQENLMEDPSVEPKFLSIIHFCYIFTKMFLFVKFFLDIVVF